MNVPRLPAAAALFDESMLPVRMGEAACNLLPAFATPFGADEDVALECRLAGKVEAPLDGNIFEDAGRLAKGGVLWPDDMRFAGRVVGCSMLC